eukprot:1102460-Pyramimonas_sp.AAC.1
MGWCGGSRRSPPRGSSPGARLVGNLISAALGLVILAVLTLDAVVTDVLEEVFCHPHSLLKTGSADLV